MFSGDLRRLPVVDVALAGTFLVAELVELVPHLTDDGFQAGPRWYNIAAQIAFVAPLAIRRRHPRACFLLLHAILLVTSLAGDRSLFFFAHELPSLLVTYTVARYDRGWVGRWAWCSGIVFTAALFAGAPPEVVRQQLSSPILLVPCGVVAWGIGRVLRRLREQGAELEDALERLAAEQSAREAAAVGAERSRIALEMHDVVVSAVSLMTRQVGAARAELEEQERDVPRLREAERSGRQALIELRRVLDVLGEPDDGADDADDADRAAGSAAAGLDGADALGERFRAAGLDLQLQVDAPPGLPLSLELAVYRILQEALTNVLKHGARDDVSAAVAAAGGELVIRVRNALAVPDGLDPIPSGRHGLVGMRERAAMFGGSLSVEQSPAGYELTVALPLPAAPAIEVASW